MKHPCSPRKELEGLICFPRMCDKIRLHHAGELHEDYHANLGRGMDLWTCQFLGVDYEALAKLVRDGASDEEALAWVRENGISRPDYEAAWWRSYMLNRGYRDDLSEHLAGRKAADGMADRDDIQCFVDYIDADEGR